MYSCNGPVVFMTIIVLNILIYVKDQDPLKRPIGQGRPANACTEQHSTRGQECELVQYIYVYLFY